MTTVQTMMVQTGGGREVCVEVAGDEAATPILVCAGTPNSRLLSPPWVEDAVSRGARLIGYDRPGYGRSSPQPGRSVADAAADVRAIATALGIQRLAVWGFSGGGPHAAACAALLPDLVGAVGVVCSIAPWGAEGLDYFSGMGDDNLNDIQLFMSDRQAARQKAHRDWQDILQVTAEGLVEAWRTLLSDVDAAVLTQEVAQDIVDSIHDGLAPGDEGWWDDGVAHMSPWGFELDSIRVPVKVWHGAQDRFVPFQHGQWLAEHIPGAEASLTEDDGHLTLIVHKAGSVQEWLLGHL